ncbi:testis-expressed protein 9-like [Liolophura sinensis]|uniref:testis-expressed protein 9-like n=1 Tax=Liolophura sinensis TaxID=3198878 RepID=UPI00315909FE
MEGRSNTAGSRAMSGTKKSATNVRNNISRPQSKDGGSTRDLLSREEEYKRLNQELEAKTADLVREAEEVMTREESFMARSRLLDNINSEDFLKDFEDDEYSDNNGGVGISPKPPSRPTSNLSNQSRPQSKTPRTKTGTRSRPRSGAKPSGGGAEDVAVPDDMFMTEFKDFSLKHTISHIEGQAEQGLLPNDDDDDVLPEVAADMGSEATIRFLKAKLRVMQEELDRLAQECSIKDEKNNALSSKVKEVEEERNRLQRTNATQQTQIDKYKHMSEEAKGKSDSLHNQLTAVKKELDSLKRSQKQQLTAQGATEVRLNRALEEVDRYKEELYKAKSSAKDTTVQEKKRVEQLIAENKRLEKQKNELMAGFKKQLKLIDILKRQKMHIEAAKMLSFSEEEFVKALEWGN